MLVWTLTALEAHLVPFEASGNSFFRGIHGFAAFGTLGVLYWFERHFVYTGKEKGHVLLSKLSNIRKISDVK